MRTTTNLPLLVLLELPGLTPTVWGEPCEAGSEEGGAGGSSVVVVESGDWGTLLRGAVGLVGPMGGEEGW